MRTPIWDSTIKCYRIPLPCGRFALVDDDDLIIACLCCWYVRKNGYCYGNSNELLHNWILEPKTGYQVDHINRDKLDNRKSNLRHVTPSQNTWNTPPRGRSGYKGVVWFPRDKRWKAQIRIGAKCKAIGYFDNIIDAARAYDRNARIIGGEYAYLNFPEELP